MLVSSIYKRVRFKTTVNTRRVNRERMRIKLARASYIDIPRLRRVAA